MMRRVVLVHTVPGLVPVFQELAKGLPGDVRISNLVDESLLEDAITAGGLTHSVNRRVVDHILSAADSGAVAILATCSSIGPAVEIASQLVEVPVLRIDEAMALAAIESGSRIGVLASVASTLTPTVDLLRRCALGLEKRVEIVPVLRDEAFTAIRSGDGAKHDKIIGEALLDLAVDVDVIVLAQASMARVVALSNRESCPSRCSRAPARAWPGWHRCWQRLPSRPPRRDRRFRTCGASLPEPASSDGR